VNKAPPLPSPTIKPLSEADIDTVFANAGGCRAHPDADRRGHVNADYRLGDAIIELKFLDEEALFKPEHQARIAALFTRHQPERPVVIVDPRLLPSEARRDYASILERPVRSAVAKARGQLKQSRNEIPDVTATILFVINNGFTALTHEELVQHVERRARNDSREIDGIVVGGCYFHSDGFDTVALWPLDYKIIYPERPFTQFEALRAAWAALADRHMTGFVRGEHGQSAKKLPVADIAFDVDGITFVKPAMPFGNESKFYGPRRPRQNTIGFDELSPVATTIPTMTEIEYRRIHAALQGEPLLQSYETWLSHIEEARASSTELKPVVPIDVTRGGWEGWRKRHPQYQGLESLRRFANDRFNQRARDLLVTAKEMKDGTLAPRRYIAIETEVIGQDACNDISHIASVLQRSNARPEIRTLISNARIPHEHAVSLAAAYAILEGVDAVFWRLDLQFAWT